MFKIKNISKNPLTLQTGRVAPGNSVSVENPTERERGFEGRGWLRIIEDQPKEKETPAAPTSPVPETKPVAKTAEDKEEKETK